MLPALRKYERDDRTSDTILYSDNRKFKKPQSSGLRLLAYLKVRT